MSLSAYITVRMIMPFRKSCHTPFYKPIPSITLTAKALQNDSRRAYPRFELVGFVYFLKVHFKGVSNEIQWNSSVNAV